MPERYLLDTHAWIWMQEGDSKLTSSTIHLVDDARRESSVYVAAISIWEIALLDHARRISLNMAIGDWLNAAFTRGRLQLAPLSPMIAIESTRLPGELHRDPADRMLVATARVENLTLLTRDARLLAYGRNGHVRSKKI